MIKLENWGQGGNLVSNFFIFLSTVLIKFQNSLQHRVNFQALQRVEVIPITFDTFSDIVDSIPIQFNALKTRPGHLDVPDPYENPPIPQIQDMPTINTQ